MGQVLNDNKIVNTWSSEVKTIFEQCDLFGTYASNSTFSLKPTISSMTSLFEIKQKEYLEQECGTKPKLSRDRDAPPIQLCSL